MSMTKCRMRFLAKRGWCSVAPKRSSKIQHKLANLYASTSWFNPCANPPQSRCLHVFEKNRAVASFAKATHHHRTPRYSPTDNSVGGLENRVVPVWARPLEPF